MTNQRYGKPELNSIKYAPRQFIENGSIFVPRIDDDEAYFSRGWLRVVDVKPEYDPTHQYLKIRNWHADTENHTVTAIYDIIEITPQHGPKKYSKLKLTLFCMQNNLWERVKTFLEQIGYYDLFVMAQYFLETDEYFNKGISLFVDDFKSKHPEVDIDSLVEQMLEFAFDGYEN